MLKNQVRLAPLARILLQYWGQKGAGVLISERLVVSLEAVASDVYLSVAVENEFFTSRSESMGENFCSIAPFYGNRPFGLKLLLSPIAFARFVLFLRRTRPDIVFCPMLNYWSPLLGMVYRLLRIKYFLLVHDATPHPGEDSWIQRLLFSLSFLNVDTFFVLSLSVKSGLMKANTYRSQAIIVSTHGNLYDGAVGVERVLKADHPVTISFLGRIREYKGLGMFIMTLLQLRKNGWVINGLICGNGVISSTDRALLDRANFIEVNNRWLSDDDFKSYLDRSDIVLLPYTEASQSGVVVAAKTFGVPLIVSPIGGLTEQVEHRVTGLVASDVTVDAFVAAVGELLNNQHMYAFISSNQIKEIAASESWAHLVTSIVGRA
ncbi:MAG: glycosyltransferase [Burkholderiaceae bacterium]